jgi:hypothetical protein
MNKTWREAAKATIQRAREEAQAQGLDAEATKRYVNARYPFGERAYHPYKIWLDEMERAFPKAWFCPTCGDPLEILAGDNGPEDDRWACADTCGIEYPHSEFPLPAGYVKEARAAEKAAALKDEEEETRARLAAWNAWATK